MIVKKLSKSALLAAALLTSSIASANGFGFKKPSIGLDVNGTTFSWKANLGKGNLPSNPIAFGAYVGTDFYSTGNFNIGLEAGTEYFRKSNKNSVAPTAQLNNYDNTTGLQVGSAASIGATTLVRNYSNKFSGYTPYLGLTVGYNVTPEFKVTGMIGTGLMFARLNQTLTTTVNNGVTTNVYSSTSYKKNAFVPMARIGAQYDVAKHFGVRVNVGYRYLKNLKATAASSSTAHYVSQANTNGLTYGAGVVFTF